jgi:hypothetical protein
MNTQSNPQKPLPGRLLAFGLASTLAVGLAGFKGVSKVKKSDSGRRNSVRFHRLAGVAFASLMLLSASLIAPQVAQAAAIPAPGCNSLKNGGYNGVCQVF